MRKFSALIIIACLPFNQVVADQVVADDNKQLVQQGREASKALGGELKKNLQAAMKAEGPLKAITVCNVKAPQVSEDISKEKGMSVARTSLKYRNQSNKPDAWEVSVLEQFEQRKAKGEVVKTLEYSEQIEVNGKKVFRYMKAIPTDKVCLVCHGSNIQEPVAARINKLYPDDKATGFNKGDIRGAFTITQALD